VPTFKKDQDELAQRQKERSDAFQKFDALDNAAKVEEVQKILINSIYECITKEKAKLPDLVKAQTILNKSLLLRHKVRDPNTKQFILTPPEPTKL